VGKAENLSTVLNSLSIAVVLRGLRVGKDARYIVSLTPMGIPRFVTWRHRGKIAIFLWNFLDQTFGPW
jgi:hypothetical protein